jgi:hypothetical protein
MQIKNRGGRPTKYQGALTVAKAKEYLQQCIDEELEFHKTRGEKSDSYERRIKVNLPSKEGLALYLKVSLNTITYWEETYPEFLQIIQEIHVEQRKRLIEGGISGEYNPVITKLLLSATHGVRESSEIKVTHETLTPEQQAKLDKLLET